MAIKAADIKNITGSLGNPGLGNAKDAERAKRFFKTGKGEYAEDKVFLGIRMPVLRQLAKEYRAISLSEIQKLIRSGFHEERLLALLILVEKFNAGDKQQRQGVYAFYLRNTRYVNDWDLVDASAYKIVGEYLLLNKRDVLVELANSKRWWERRIAIVASYQLIRQREFQDTLKVAKILLHDSEDLVQKAVGWMLREVGNRERKVEQQFLDQHYKSMPRTMLRYAIEKFPQAQRQAYLSGSR